MSAIKSTTIVARGSSHVETEVADQVMMMSIEQGKYYALEGTAKVIWQRLEEPLAVSELIDQLVTDYDVSSEQCTADVTGFLEHMMQNGLVVEHDTAQGA